MEYEAVEGEVKKVDGCDHSTYQVTGARYATRLEVLCWHFTSRWDRFLDWLRQ